MMKHFPIVTLAFTTLLFSCVKDTPDTPKEEQAPVILTAQKGHGVFISNEGNFNFANASLSNYVFKTGSVTEDVYSSNNGNAALGDVLQSMNIINGKLYLVVNHSNKIEILDTTNYKKVGRITGLNSPRYMQAVSAEKAYVTDLYDNAISIINLKTNAVIGKIQCSGWTEELLQVGSEVFITNKKTNKVYVVNVGTDAITDSISVTYGSNSLRLDKNGMLWVLCNGNDTEVAALYKIKPATHEIEKSFSFASTSDAPSHLRINGTADQLYFLNDNVYQMSAEAGSLPANAVVNKEGRNFYGLNINPFTGDIYVADAIDYVQKGRVYIYTASGSALGNFKVGLIPNGFLFY